MTRASSEPVGIIPAYKTSRRGFISGFASLIAAPAIVRAQSIMPVRSIDPAAVEYTWTLVGLGYSIEYKVLGMPNSPLVIGSGGGGGALPPAVDGIALRATEHPALKLW